LALRLGLALMPEILGGIVAVQLTLVIANRTFDLGPNGSWFGRGRGRNAL
jgi:hypothetical protein